MARNAANHGTRSIEHLIERVTNTSDQYPPWKGMEFTKSVDSDDLADDLKRAYPQCATLRERKHMAAIDFLKAELRDMQSRNVSAAASIEEEYLATPEPFSPRLSRFDDRRRFGSTSSLQSSLHEERIVHQNNKTEAAAPKGSTAIQQIVFDASDGRTLQPKVKRSMTEAEKAGYRKTRKRGACSPCRRLKGKCTHVNDDRSKSNRSEGTAKRRKRTTPPDLSGDHDRTDRTSDQVGRPNIEDTKFVQPVTPDAITNNVPNTQNAAEMLKRQTQGSPDRYWAQGMDESGQSDQARYVQNLLPGHTYGLPVPYHSNTAWSHYPNTTDMQHSFSNGYGQRFDTVNLPEGSVPMSPAIQASPMDISYQFTFPDTIQEPWNGTEDHQLDNMDPG